MLLAIGDTVRHASKGCGKVVKIDTDYTMHVEVPSPTHGDPQNGGLDFAPSTETAPMGEWALCHDKLFEGRDASGIPSIKPGYSNRAFQIMILAYVTSRPHGIPKTWISLYSVQRQIGKSDVVEYMVNKLGALVISGVHLDKDIKAIQKKHNVPEGDEKTELTPFQKKPILILALTAEDSRLKNKCMYENLETISDGTFLADGGWGETPAHLIAIGNDHLDPKGFSAGGAGRVHAYHIKSDHSIAYNMNFQSKVAAKRKAEELMSKIEDEVCDGKDRENAIFEELFLGHGEETTLKFTVMIDKMIDLEGPSGFWSKYRYMKGGEEAYRKKDFVSWMTKQYPSIQKTLPKNVPHYTVQYPVQ